MSGSHASPTAQSVPAVIPTDLAGDAITDEGNPARYLAGALESYLAWLEREGSRGSKERANSRSTSKTARLPSAPRLPLNPVIAYSSYLASLRTPRPTRYGP